MWPHKQAIWPTNYVRRRSIAFISVVINICPSRAKSPRFVDDLKKTSRANIRPASHGFTRQARQTLVNHQQNLSH